jgi:uncharacterized protein (DUF1778 family)
MPDAATAQQHDPAASSRKTPRKSERLVTRTTLDLKRLAQHAADLEGQTLTEFVAASVQGAAERTIREREVTRVSAEYGRAFADALVHPPAPSARAQEAAAFFMAVMGDQ